MACCRSHREHSQLVCLDCEAPRQTGPTPLPPAAHRGDLCNAPKSECPSARRLAGDEVELSPHPWAPASRCPFLPVLAAERFSPFHGWLDDARRSDRRSESHEGIGRRTVPDLAKDGPLSGMNELREIRHEPHGLTTNVVFIITNAFIIVN